MPTSAPGTFKCGTWYPIWLNGTLPTAEHESVSRPVCLQTFSAICEKTWDIQIKKCSGGYLVYQLDSSPVIDSAYCFGSTSKCPNGTSSETGFEPGCSAHFPSGNFTPEVQVSLKNGNRLSSENLEPVFNCFFNDLSTAYVYDVYWYINGYSVKTIKNKAYINIGETDLRPADWTDSFQMNMLVKCAVRLRNSVGSTPGYHQSSGTFVAGVIPDKYLYQVDEGSFVNIEWRSTVPVSCAASFLMNRCKETIKLSYPRNESCSFNSSVSNIIIKESCGFDIYATDWKAKHTIQVYGNVDNLYNKESVRYAAISFLKEGSISEAWAKVNIPDVIVYIKDKDSLLSGKYCDSWADPYIKTFDYPWGREAYISGEYVLYRHKREPYWIHTLSTRCFWGTCNVGVAIRSHDSLLVVRTVDEVYNPLPQHTYSSTFSGHRAIPVIDFRNCDDKNMLISRNNKHFKVTLPTGTEINFDIQPTVNVYRNDTLYQITHITIKPSLLDIQQTEGLCGYLSSNGNESDDLKERGSGKIVNWNSFLSSWAINHTSEESLFAHNPRFNNDIFYYKPFCTCVKQAIQPTPIADNYNQVNCNLTQPLEQCYQTTTNVDSNLYSSCSSRKRRDTSNVDDYVRVRRSTYDPEDVEDEPTPLRYSPDFVFQFIPPALEWRNGWTEESARTACLQAFASMPGVALCRDYGNIDIMNYIPSCILDIKASGNTTLIGLSIRALFSACTLEISRNQTLILSQSNEEGVISNSESILDGILSQLCVTNCSNNGVCEKGFCICKNGFIGGDCAISKTKPPTTILIPDEGRCGLRRRNCEKTNIYGNFESQDVWCRLSYFQVLNNMKQSLSSTQILKAEVRSPSIVTCPLPASNNRGKRSLSDKIAEGYDISLSYDGNNFGDDTVIIIYDDDCYECNSTTVTCALLDSCPLLTTTSHSTISHVLTATDDLLSTTSKPNQPNESSKDRSNTIIIACSVIICVSVLVVLAVVIYRKCLAQNITPKINEHNEVLDKSDNQHDNFVDYQIDNCAPYITQLPTRPNSAISFHLDLKNPKTLDDLFCVEK